MNEENWDSLVGRTRATLHCRRSPAHCAAGRGCPPLFAAAPRASERAGPERGEASLITLSGRSGTAIEWARAISARRAGRRSS
ncbi:jg15273 [Pararge aegeria aegeria]|uniref:Jg15273 protein n=1 Tax=Pararge aegeria aegeria TaxID=348720 RepID=A0A8S4R8C2_9NEOP|nr:jg15273 [Pararge aegeria aegeria]